MHGGQKDCACKMLGPLGRSGPLGADNMRQQLGRSFKLRVGNSPQQAGVAPLNRESTLIFTGSGVEDQETGKAAGDAYASAMSITCHLDMIDDLPEPQPQPGDIIGEIEWGTDGTSAKAQFDWKHGTVIQVSGSFVRLDAFLEGIPGVCPRAHLSPAPSRAAGAPALYFAFRDSPAGHCSYRFRLSPQQQA